MCTRSDALNPGASYPAIAVTVNVSASAGSPLSNSVSVSGGGSASNNATDPTTITPLANPAFFAGEVSLGSGVYYLQFPDGSLFGYYNFPSFPIFFHYDLGFESFIDAHDGNAGAFLYDFASKHWFYTSPRPVPVPV